MSLTILGNIWQRIGTLASQVSNRRWIVFIAANGALIYLCSKIWYYSAEYNPWERLGITFIDRIFWYGSYRDNLKKPLHEVEIERYHMHNHRRFYGYFQGAYPVISVCKPNYISRINACAFKRVFPTGNAVLDSTFSYFETERWRNVRGTIRKVLDTENVMFRYAFEEVVETMYEQVNIIKTGFGNGRPIDVKRIFDAFTFDAACKALLISDFETIKNPDHELLKEIRRALNTGDNYATKLILKSHFPKIAEWIKSLFPDEDLKHFKEKVHKNIQEKYLYETVDFFLVRNVLDVMFSDEDSYFEDEHTKTTLRLEDATYQFLFYVIFGSYKVSTLATMACYLLANHEDVQSTLREKICEVIIRDKGVYRYNSFNDIEYLDCVINETLRLYPPVAKIERLADKKLGIKDTNKFIPKGTHITIPICGIHTDSQKYENPREFDPSRFLHKPPRQDKFLPFGMHPRKCIGETFARMLTKIILVYIVGNFTIGVSPHTKKLPKFGLGTQTLLSVEEMVLRLTTREDSPFEIGRL